MNKLLFIVLTLIGFSAFGQNGSVDGAAFHTKLTDSTKIVTPVGYGTLAYFPQDSPPTWKIWENGIKYDLKKFGLSSTPGTGVFAANVTFTLSPGKSFGKYTNGQTATWIGLTAVQAMLDAAIEYINPVFTSFTITAEPTVIEVGTTLSGSKPFAWAITVNSGIVPTIDIFDNTATSTLLAGTANDGSESVTIATIQLNSNGATQSWKGIGNNTSPVGTFNSSNFIVTSRFYRFYGAASASVTNSAQVRALASSVFQTGATTFNLLTGTTLTKFIVALPPSVTIMQVIDLDALSADITSQYISLGTVNVLDAGGTNRAYNIYEMNVGSPYSNYHRHAITTH